MKNISNRLQALEDAEWDRRHAAEDTAMQQLTDGELELLIGFVRKHERAGLPIELGTARRVSSVPWCNAQELAAAQRYEELYFAAYERGVHANA